MEKCKVLEEYSQLVATTRDCMLVEKDMQAALNRAVDGCIERGIFVELLCIFECIEHIQNFIGNHYRKQRRPTDVLKVIRRKNL